MVERNETTYSINYELLGIRFQLATDNHEMKHYLEDVLERHITLDKNRPIDFRFFIPFIEPDKRRYLTRTAPDSASILTDVQFSSDTHAPCYWSSTAPPLIPFNTEAIDGKFFAYHAAAVITSTMEAIILLGNKGAGKSTNALALCKERGWSLLSDETCVVRSRDLVIQALLRQPHGYTVDTQNIARKGVIRFSDNPWLKTEKEGVPILAVELIFVPGLVKPHSECVTDKKIATQILVRHQLQFGGTPESAQECSEALANMVTLIQIYHGGYLSFPSVQEQIMCTLNRILK